MEMTKAFKVLIIIPAYNEADAIADVVGNIRKSIDADILVVDDGSKDDTYARAYATGAYVVRLPFNLGIGGAVQTGFVYAKRYGYDAAVQIDGDGQHDPQYLKALLEPIRNAQADMVIGSRFLSHDMPKDQRGFQSTFTRRIGINFFVRLINALLQTHVSDPTSGFRAFNKRLIQLFAKHYPQDFPEPEAIVAAKRSGANIVEIPVVMRSRMAGKSSIRHLKSAYYMVKVTLAIVLHMLRKTPGEL